MFQQLWQINIIHCVIRSPADYMTEWMFESGDSKTKKKKWETIRYAHVHALEKWRIKNSKASQMCI